LYISRSLVEIKKSSLEYHFKAFEMKMTIFSRNMAPFTNFLLYSVTS